VLLHRYDLLKKGQVCLVLKVHQLSDHPAMLPADFQRRFTTRQPPKPPLHTCWGQKATGQGPALGLARTQSSVNKQGEHFLSDLPM